MTTAVERMHKLRSHAAPKALSQAQIANFDRDGFLFPLEGISVASALEARRKVEEEERKENASGNAIFANMHITHRWVYDLATQPHILDAVEDLIGPDIYIWTAKLWIKEPKSGSWIGWHQDSQYWGLEPRDTVSLWMALTDVTPAHGPMEFYAGSHNEPPMVHSDDYMADNMLSRGQVIPELQNPKTLDRSRVHADVLRPGQYSLHHLQLAHGGPPNEGDDRRIGFNVVYCAGSTSNVRESGRYGMPVRGCAPEVISHLNLVDPIPSSDTPSAANLAARAEKAARSMPTVMSDADPEKTKRVVEERKELNLPSFLNAPKQMNILTGQQLSTNPANAKL